MIFKRSYSIMQYRKRLKLRKTQMFLMIAIFTVLFCAYIVFHIYVPMESNLQKNPDFVARALSGKYKMKTILLWSDLGLHPFDLFLEGSMVFESLNCSYQNCYVTTVRNLLGGDLTLFDAIAFNGQDLTADNVPEIRSPKQNYIYFNTESADYYPVCDETFDGFFNMTATYRLDSNIVFNYFDVRNNKGKVVGPRVDMNWNEKEVKSDKEINFNKTKAVAWFVAECESRSSKLDVAKNLQRALEVHGYTLDIYGDCGNIQFSWDNKTLCNLMLRNDYYFYFSAENSFCEDYVTEEILIALQNDVVPIVYGGADYHRFLPPHSFIDARAYSPEELAKLIVKLIDTPDLYQHYFWWKEFYSYHLTNLQTQICAVCKTLNRKTKMVYQKFRRWWYPKYRKRCHEED